jgi:hypothetical protein
MRTAKNVRPLLAIAVMVTPPSYASAAQVNVTTKQSSVAGRTREQPRKQGPQAVPTSSKASVQFYIAGAVAGRHHRG